MVPLRTRPAFPDRRSLASRLAAVYNPAMRKYFFGAILVLSISVPGFAAQKPLKADQVLAAAKSQAAGQNKSVFVIFQASWCEDCHRLDALLAAPEIQPIFAKYYVIARINVGEENGGNPALNNPGGLNLLIKFGGVGPGGVADIPFISILSDKGKLIVNSNPPAHSNMHPEGVGYPAKPAEIDWFMTMLKKSSPALTAEDAQVVNNWLAKNGDN